ncbi:class I SAM-dependent methyltransferase [Chitinispirillales bacterium ANBcel5]|uniref:class I SAM-dependent methyltransferase n=1 Tax=Cellulosispirillum alkaliphilum TaxID=3039283 RepID=UPI002A520DDC|nr:class I SAM-dependent methyltransferase [Chitinispirillales bacterium ANBcel5]
MKSMEESVLTALDATDKGLFPFLPYILQDFWEIGSDPESLIPLIKNHNRKESPNVLDLGCGKGAVTVKLASKLGYRCYGIDAVSEFINFARKKAVQYNVQKICKFEAADIRVKVKDLHNYDIIILGSVGQVFGKYYETLQALSPVLNDDGFIVIDDGYIDDQSDFTHPQVPKRKEMVKQIISAKMRLVDEVISCDNADFQAYDTEYALIEKRCNELIEKNRDKSHLFKNYMSQQRKEYGFLKNEIVCATLVIKKDGKKGQ